MRANKKSKAFKRKLKTAYFSAVNIDQVKDVTIGDELRSVASEFPELLALVEITDNGSIGRSWTYQTLLNDSLQLAEVLSNRHKKGTRVAVWAPNYPEWVILELAVALSGLVLVTANPSFQAEELEYVLKKSQSKELFVATSYRGNPMWEIAKTVASKLSTVQGLNDIRKLKKYINKNKAQVVRLNKPLPKVLPNDPVQIQFTSGTTGFPKGAKLHHMGLLNNAMSFQKRMGMEMGDRWLNCMPMFHCSGAAMAALGCLTLRATHFIMEKFEAKNWCEIVKSCEITYLQAVPTMFVEILSEWKKGNYKTSKIKGMSTGGSSVPPSLVQEINKVFGVRVQIVYGQTEASPVISLAWSDDTFDNITRSVGQPLPNIDVAIKDPINREIKNCGEIGEICSRGYNTMLEYHQNPEATKEAIDNDNWLHTGDLGVMDENGYLAVKGRVKEMIIRGGENIYPREIENYLLQHEDISEVAIVGVPDEKYGEIVGCFLKFKIGKSIDSLELKQYIRGKISPQKTPSFWVQITEWPLTGSGKIKKHLLREQYISGLLKPMPL